MCIVYNIIIILVIKYTLGQKIYINELNIIKYYLGTLSPKIIKKKYERFTIVIDNNNII